METKNGGGKAGIIVLEDRGEDLHSITFHEV